MKNWIIIATGFLALGFIFFISLNDTMENKTTIRCENYAPGEWSVSDGEIKFGMMMYNYITEQYEEVPGDIKDYSPYLMQIPELLNIYHIFIAAGMPPLEAFIATSEILVEIMEDVASQPVGEKIGI